LQIIKNKANHHPTRHHAENCINSLAPSVGNDKSFLAKNKFRTVTYGHITPFVNKRGFTQIYATPTWDNLDKSHLTLDQQL
jgi:hypothetical protein